MRRRPPPGRSYAADAPTRQFLRYDEVGTATGTPYDAAGPAPGGVCTAEDGSTWTVHADGTSATAFTSRLASLPVWRARSTQTTPPARQAQGNYFYYAFNWEKMDSTCPPPRSGHNHDERRAHGPFDHESVRRGGTDRQGCERHPGISQRRRTHPEPKEGNYDAASINALGLIGNISQLGRACFAAGTPLLTPDGAKPIEEFKVGNLVISAPEDNSDAPVVVCRVEKTVPTPRADRRIEPRRPDDPHHARAPLLRPGQGLDEGRCLGGRRPARRAPTAAGRPSND